MVTLLDQTRVIWNTNWSPLQYPAKIIQCCKIAKIGRRFKVHPVKCQTLAHFKFVLIIKQWYALNTHNSVGLFRNKIFRIWPIFVDWCCMPVHKWWIEVWKGRNTDDHFYVLWHQFISKSSYVTTTFLIEFGK